MTDTKTESVDRQASSTKDAVLAALPGMTGAIDNAFVTEVKTKIAFVLVAFVDGAAVHCTNINPPEQAMQALCNLADALRAE